MHRRYGAGLNAPIASLLLTLPFALSERAEAEPPFELDDRADEFLVAGAAEYLGDPEGVAAPEDVLSPALVERFRPTGTRRPNFGYRYRELWLRYSLHNASAHEHWTIEVAREWIDESELYRVTGGATELVDRWTRDLPEGQSALAQLRPALAFSLAPGETGSFLVRIRSRGPPIAFHGRVYRRAAFAASQQIYLIGFGIFYSALAILALFNLLLWSSIRATGFLALAATLASYGIGEAGSHGHLALLGPQAASLGPRIGVVALALVGAGLAWVTRTMLRTWAEAPRLDAALRFAIAINVALAVPGAVTSEAHSWVFYTLIATNPIVVVSALSRALTRDADAIAFFAALYAWMGPAAVAMGGIVGLLPEFPAVENAAHAGATLMMVLLSFVVARQVHRVHRAAERFVPHAFLDLLERANVAEVERGDALRRTMTVLFADVRGFTTQSESRSPEESIAWLNQYLETVEPPIRRAGGFVNQFYGDGIVALFESADGAVEAACEVLAQLARVGHLGDGVPVEIGIGVHTGPLMLGAIGAAQRLDTGVVGDSVNTASRIESYTKEYGRPLLISGTTQAALQRPESWKIEFVDRVAPKGKSQLVELYSVEPARGAPA